MAGALLMLLAEKVKVILKNIFDNNLFTFVKFIIVPEATNLIRYIFKEIGKRRLHWQTNMRGLLYG